MESAALAADFGATSETGSAGSGCAAAGRKIGGSSCHPASASAKFAKNCGYPTNIVRQYSTSIARQNEVYACMGSLTCTIPHSCGAAGKSQSSSSPLEPSDSQMEMHVQTQGQVRHWLLLQADSRPGQAPQGCNGLSVCQQGLTFSLCCVCPRMPGTLTRLRPAQCGAVGAAPAAPLPQAPLPEAPPAVVVIICHLSILFCCVLLQP